MALAGSLSAALNRLWPVRPVWSGLSVADPRPDPAQRNVLVLIGAVTVALTLEHGLFGGNRSDIALCFTIAYGLLLLGAAATSWGAGRLAALRGLGVGAGLLALTLAPILLSLTPFDLDNRAGRIAGATGASLEPLATAVEAAKLMGYASAYILAALMTQDRRGRDLFLRALLISAVAVAALSLLAEVLSSMSIGGWTKPIIARGRTSGLFSSPNTAATVFAVNALLAAGGLVRVAGDLRRRRLRKQVREMLTEHGLEIVAFILSFQCLILSSSRGGIAAFIAAATALAAWLGWGSRRRLVAFGLLGGLGLAVGLVNGGLALHRYETGAYTGDDRLLWFRTAWGAFQGAPLQGYGLGSLPQVFRATATPETFRALDWAGSAHNVYLQWLVEGGLLGSVPMFALVAWTFSRAIARAPGEPAGSILRPTLVAGAFLIILHSSVEYSLQEPSIATLLAVILGGASGLGVSSGAGVVKSAPRATDTRRRAAPPRQGSAGGNAQV